MGYKKENMKNKLLILTIFFMFYGLNSADSECKDNRRNENSLKAKLYVMGAADGDIATFLREALESPVAPTSIMINYSRRNLPQSIISLVQKYREQCMLSHQRSTWLTICSAKK